MKSRKSHVIEIETRKKWISISELDWPKEVFIVLFVNALAVFYLMNFDTQKASSY